MLGRMLADRFRGMGVNGELALDPVTASAAVPYGGMLRDGPSVQDRIPPPWYGGVIRPYCVLDVAPGRSKKMGTSSASLVERRRQVALQTLPGCLAVFQLLTVDACRGNESDLAMILTSMTPRPGTELHGGQEAGELPWPWPRTRWHDALAKLSSAKSVLMERTRALASPARAGRQPVLGVQCVPCLAPGAADAAGAGAARRGDGLAAGGGARHRVPRPSAPSTALTRGRLSTLVLGCRDALEGSDLWSEIFDGASSRGVLISDASAENLFQDQRAAYRAAGLGLGLASRARARAFPATAVFLLMCFCPAAAAAACGSLVKLSSSPPLQPPRTQSSARGVLTAAGSAAAGPPAAGRAGWRAPPPGSQRCAATACRWPTPARWPRRAPGR